MDFELGRLRRSERIAGASALALFVILFFFKWYGGSASAPAGGVEVSASLNGWHSFTSSRWIWLITIAVALGDVALKAARRDASTPLPPSVLVAGLGALSALLILYRILHHPSGGASGTIGAAHFSYSYGIKLGIWLGLIAAAGVAYGGYQAMRDDGISRAAVRRRSSGS
jgi:hypothetical protein